MKQTITYWLPNKTDGNGVKTYHRGVAIKSRWMKKDGVVITENGTEQKTTHVVYCNFLIPKRARIALVDLDRATTPPVDAKTVLDNFYNPTMSKLSKMVL